MTSTRTRRIATVTAVAAAGAIPVIGAASASATTVTSTNVPSVANLANTVGQDLTSTIHLANPRSEVPSQFSGLAPTTHPMIPSEAPGQLTDALDGLPLRFTDAMLYQARHAKAPAADQQRRSALDALPANGVERTLGQVTNLLPGGAAVSQAVTSVPSPTALLAEQPLHQVTNALSQTPAGQLTQQL